MIACVYAVRIPQPVYKQNQHNLPHSLSITYEINDYDLRCTAIVHLKINLIAWLKFIRKWKRTQINMTSEIIERFHSLFFPFCPCIRIQMLHTHTNEVEKNVCISHKLWGEYEIIDYLFWLLLDNLWANKNNHHPLISARVAVVENDPIQFYLLFLREWKKNCKTLVSIRECEYLFVVVFLPLMYGTLTCFYFPFKSDTYKCAGITSISPIHFSNLCQHHLTGIHMIHKGHLEMENTMATTVEKSSLFCSRFSLLMSIKFCVYVASEILPN